jgi:hypothetical protein
MKTRERSIIFSTEMVRAILAGKKTQTRRVVTRKGYNEEIHQSRNDYAYREMDDLWRIGYRAKYRSWPQGGVGVCPRYQTGEILWVRETFCPDWCEHVIYKADSGSAKAAGYEREPKWLLKKETQ